MVGFPVAKWLGSSKFEIVSLVTLLTSVLIFYGLVFGEIDIKFISFVILTVSLVFPLSFLFVSWLSVNSTQLTREASGRKLIDLLHECDAYRSSSIPEIMDNSEGEMFGILDLAKLYQAGKYVEMTEMMSHLIHDSKVRYSRIIGLSVVKREDNAYWELYREGNCTAELLSPIASELNRPYTTLIGYPNPASSEGDDELSFDQHGRPVNPKEHVILIAGILTNGRAIYQAANYLRHHVEGLVLEHVFVYIIRPLGDKRQQVTKLLKEGNINAHYIIEASEIYQAFKDFGYITSDEELERDLKSLEL